MKKIVIIFIFFFIQTLNLKSEDFKLNQLISGLNSPWSLSFKDQKEILITEKSGQIIIANLIDNKIKKINHNLNILEDGQGGLLEILFHNGIIFVFTQKTEVMVNQVPLLLLLILIMTI